VLEACRDVDAIPAGFGGISFIQAYNVPMTPTSAFPGALISGLPFLPSGLGNRLSHRATRQVLWQAVRMASAAARKQATGYWFLDEPAGWLPPAALEKFLEAAMGVGLVAGGIALGAWGGFKHRILTSLLGVGLAGAALSLANGPLFAIMQATVAKDMQGRVFTLLGSVGGIMMPLGLAVAGPVSDAIGVQTWYLVAGAVTVAMAAAALFVPPLMGIEGQAALRSAGRPPQFPMRS
jgi:hypothetical protein